MVVSFFCLSLSYQKHKAMYTELNSVERVLFKATKEFHLQNGATESEANKAANDKIIQKRKLGKTLTFRH